VYHHNTAYPGKIRFQATDQAIFTEAKNLITVAKKSTVDKLSPQFKRREIETPCSQSAGGHRSPLTQAVCPGKVRYIYTYSHKQRTVAVFQQNSCHFAVVQQQIIGPLHAHINTAHFKRSGKHIARNQRRKRIRIV
jgi:hypothetical protein